MAGRPRNVSDEDLINATIRVMSRLGPVKLTLAEVAKEAGVSLTGPSRDITRMVALIRSSSETFLGRPAIRA